MPPVNHSSPSRTGPMIDSRRSNILAKIPDTNCSAAQTGPLRTLSTRPLNIFRRKSPMSPINFSNRQKSVSRTPLSANFDASSVKKSNGLTRFNLPKNCEKMKFSLPKIPSLTLLIIPFTIPFDILTILLSSASISTTKLEIGSTNAPKELSKVFVNAMKSVSA